ncbi:hypothetical protein [uncultured Shewanella sp.]|uniref:hypothetical protein n=1 Tax=uncultured Shewanella sp. TaxID=173975 RepID=UPI002623DDFC|nr:hypothetical protein [uncultured Shewanella sp.]
MSQLKLFRQEALKNQYKSAEFSEVVIEPPKSIVKSFYLLILAIVCALIITWFIPISAEKWVDIRLQNSNFQPLMSATPSLIEQQLITSGTLVNKGQALAQVRQFNDQFPQGQIETLYAPTKGKYFAEALIGTTHPPLQPIGRILKPSKNYRYAFTSSNSLPSIHLGQLIKIQMNNAIFTAKVISLSTGKYPHIGIQFDSPPDTQLFSPMMNFKLLVGEKQRNIFALVRGNNVDH